MKICTKCNLEKRESEFSKNSKSADGLQLRCKSCYKEYYQKNRDKIIKRSVKRQQENKEQIAEYNTKYWKENKDRLAEVTAEWRRKNPEKVRNHRRAVRLKRQGVKQGIKYNSLEIFERDNWICQLCQEPVVEKDPMNKFGPTIDHIIPITKNGIDCETNVQLAHRSCNSSKGNKIQELACVSNF